MVPKPDIERFFHSLKRKFYFSFECLPAPTCPSTNQSASGEDVALDPRGSTQTGQSTNVSRKFEGKVHVRWISGVTLSMKFYDLEVPLRPT